MNIKQELQGTDKLSFFQDLYENAKAKVDEAFEKLDQHYEQYRGSPKMDGGGEDAKVVRNITYELIESQITGYIPSAKVDTRMISDKNIRNTEAIERLMQVTMDRLNIEEINDIDERYTYIYGGSIFLLEWDESITTHNTVGDVKLTCISPRKFVPQPNIYNVQDMEYCFISFETTKEQIMRKYGVPYVVAETAAREEGGDDEDTATLYVCYYKDDDGKICQYVWSGDTELLDVDDYYARKRKVCTKCGKREGLCECEKPKFKLMSEDYEELDHDIVVEGEVVIPAMSEVIKDGKVVTDDHEEMATGANGMPQFDVDANGNLIPQMTLVQTPRTEPTKLPFYRPTLLPIEIRKNTSQEDSILGQSDCEFIRPQQQAINKVETRMLEKLLKAGVVPTVPDDYEGAITDGIFDRAVRLKQGQQGLFGRIDLEVSIQGDMAESERLYDHAKRILGISDSYQGQYDASAQSGVAKQVQVNQSSGRLESKRRMKNSAYATMYEIIFQLYLAYADEPRPISYKDTLGRVRNTEFNRYAFIERDDAGEYYYNDQYLFSADNATDVEQYRQYLWESNLNLYRSGAFGDPASSQARATYWRQMERAHYPFAHAMVEEVEEQMESEIAQMQQQMAEMQGQMDAQSREIDHRKQYERYLGGS
jgi:hypothetical protein